MDEMTLRALRESIKKWENICNYGHEDNGIVDCELCKIFHHSNICCGGCPVAGRTGVLGCRETPYHEWWIYTREHDEARIFDDESEMLAFAELDFLRSLLP